MYCIGNTESESIRAFNMCVVQGHLGLKGALGRHDMSERSTLALYILVMPSYIRFD